jgi:two-component system, OmpR family, response regulator
MSQGERTANGGPTSESSAAVNTHAMPNGLAPAATRSRRGVRDRRLRVLLVEDSPLLVDRLSELVSDLPTVELVGTAASEAEAVARLDRNDVDAVILDLQLRTGSGFGVLRALNQRAAAPDVIVFTNFAIGAYRDTALALGARHFLDKSRDYARLPGVLQELSDCRH